MKVEDLERQHLVVLGLGREGLSSCKFLRQHFPAKRLGIADRSSLEQLAPESRQWIEQQSNIDLFLGKEYLNSLKDAQLILRTPGISLALPELVEATRRGVKFSSQTEIFLANCRGVTVGVTGTKGKSTTASLICAMLKEGGRDAHLLGNIGVPALEYLALSGGDTVFVLELSSYQLEGLGLSPEVAVLLDIHPEHLTYHGSFERYVEAKANITLHQSSQDYFIWNFDSDIVRAIASSSQAQQISFSAGGDVRSEYYLQSQILYGKDSAKICSIESPALPGRFNQNNIVAAASTASSLGVSGTAISQALLDFKPLEHRFEFVGTFRRIAFYNASLSTIPQATLAHLEALKGQVDTILLGGHDRHLDFSSLAEGLLLEGVRNLILFPDTGKRIWEAVQIALAANPSAQAPRVFFVDSMRNAITLCYEHTAPGKACLLSPACSSFGLFRDYKERGEQFKYWVRSLA